MTAVRCTLELSHLQSSDALGCFVQLTLCSSIGYNDHWLLRGEPVKVDILKIRDTKGASLPVVGSVELDDVLDEGNEVRFLGPVEVTGTLVNTGDYLVFTGTARAVVELLCDRCTESFESSVEGDVRSTFIDANRTPMQSAGATQRDDQADDVEIRQFQGNEIDLTDEVRETILLALPSKRLCSPECEGICQSCGANRNSSDCACKGDSGDPRLAELSRLLQD